MTKPPSKPPKPSQPRHGHLSEEETELWHYVTQTVTRLDTKRSKSARTPDQESAPKAAKKAAEHAGRLPSSAPLAPKSRRQAARPPEFDRREARQIARGRIEIEARLDLHGLRQNDAHRRLSGFLRRAHEQGLRHVLVITGKGRFDDDHHALPFHDTLDRAPRGILRRSVPLWLEEPALADIVLSYREAAAHHGGVGALYVRLRSSNRRR